MQLYKLFKMKMLNTEKWNDLFLKRVLELQNAINNFLIYCFIFWVQIFPWQDLCCRTWRQWPSSQMFHQRYWYREILNFDNKFHNSYMDSYIWIILHHPSRGAYNSGLGVLCDFAMIYYKAFFFAFSFILTICSITVIWIYTPFWWII